MITRKSITKKTRFEIFKRDSFTCQYCGNHPPECILEVDHIIPVASGGTDCVDNLVTSCFDCNRGKAAEITYNGKCYDRFRYFCGICINKIKANEEQE